MPKLGTKICSTCAHELTSEKYDRACITLPMALSIELRNEYPYMEFSSLITILVYYAHAAGFMKRLPDINPELWADFSISKRGRKPVTPQPVLVSKPPSARAVARAAAMVASDAPDEIEEFGVYDSD